MADAWLWQHIAIDSLDLMGEQVDFRVVRCKKRVGSMGQA